MSRIVDVEPLDCLAWKEGEHGTTFDDGVLWVLEKISELPTIEPERKKGKWNFIGDQMFECSECGTYYTQSQFHQMRVRISDTEFPKFCPNCGADMRKDGDTE